MAEEETQAQETPENNPSKLDELEAQISELEGKIDESAKVEDNSAEEAGTKPEEASDFNARIEALESENKRLQDMVGRLILVNGARISAENQTGVEAFPTTIEKDFDKDPDMPSLQDIVLGS